MLFLFPYSHHAILTLTHLNAAWYEVVTRELLRPEALTNGQSRQPPQTARTTYMSLAVKMGSPLLQNTTCESYQRLKAGFFVSLEMLYDSDPHYICCLTPRLIQPLPVSHSINLLVSAPLIFQKGRDYTVVKM